MSQENVEEQMGDISRNEQTWSSASWSTYSWGRMSTRVENCCPIFIKVGPNLKSPSFNHLASFFLFSFLFPLVIPPKDKLEKSNWKFEYDIKHKSFQKSFTYSTKPLYANFWFTSQALKRKVTAKNQISQDLWIVEHALNWFQQPPGATETYTRNFNRT